MMGTREDAHFFLDFNYANKYIISQRFTGRYRGKSKGEIIADPGLTGDSNFLKKCHLLILLPFELSSKKIKNG